METVLRGQRSTAIVSLSERSKQVFYPWWCRQRPFRRALRVGSRGCFAGIQWQNTSKWWQLSPFDTIKSHLFVGVRKSRLILKLQNYIPRNGWLSNSCVSSLFSFSLLWDLLPSRWKRGVDSCFCCANGCRRAYFSLSMQSNALTKLRIFFGISSLFPSFSR